MRAGLMMAGLLMVSPAMAQGNAAATRKAQDEARQYLRVCMMDEGDEKRMCEASRTAFMRDYQGAMAGDYQSQRNISAYLQDRSQVRTDFIRGIEPNVLQSCAWALVTLNSGHARANEHDVAYVRIRCGHQDVDRRAAELRAEAIMAEIRRSPAQMPVEPRVQRRPGSMVTTASPLGSD